MAMDSKHHTTIPLRLASIGLIAATMVPLGLVFSAQSSFERGTITGKVTADQGVVRAFRVAAHNLDLRIWYTVFTNKGQYVVPQALPGRYELTVVEPGYDSPRVSVRLGSGENQTANLALTRRATERRSNPGGGDEGPPARGDSFARTVFVDTLDELYPAGPAKALLREHCVGCHRDDFGSMHYTKDAFMRGIEKMTETGPANNHYALALGRTVITKQQKEMIADYLVAHFGPGMPDKRLRVEPLLFDENVASKAIYVSYDIPDDLPFPSMGNRIGGPAIDGVIEQLAPETRHHLQAAAISPLDGRVWYSSRASSSILGLDPKQLDPARRWENHPIKGEPYVHPTGIAVDRKGRVYWAEARGSRLGELDPATGRQIRYALPAQAGAMLQVVVDKDQNVGFSLIWGAFFGRMQAASRRLHMFPTPTPDNGIYGLDIDQAGNMWGAGWQKGTINKWDIRTESVTEYPVPSAWGQIRRVGVDSKGIVWGAAYNTGILVRLDPTTGRTTDYKLPVMGAQPYDAWPDKLDNIWTADHVHSAVVKLDPRTSTWTFYPMPQPNQSLPKFEVAPDNTLWFGSRGVPVIAAVHFYPHGYGAGALPMP
jgi:streptogramin lyase